jgi:hypothetical protein
MVNCLALDQNTGVFILINITNLDKPTMSAMANSFDYF